MFSPDDFKLSYSTLAAPKLTIPQLSELATSSGFAGIELVVAAEEAEAHAHGIQLDAPPARMAEARQALADAGVGVSCIATPLVFAQESEAAVDELKRYVTLAETLGCKCVRVFGGSLTAGNGELAGLVDAVTDAIADGVAFAEQTSVSVLLETCGDFSTTKYAREVIKQVYSDHFGVLWDVADTFRCLETVEEAYDNLSGQVKHVHVSDFQYVDGRMKRQPVALGDGEVAYGSAVKFLAHDGFEGYLSVEGIEGEPEEALPQHAQVLHKLIGDAFPEPVETE
jgi:sugar phosphate isomerase/epimerase